MRVTDRNIQKYAIATINRLRVPVAYLMGKIITTVTATTADMLDAKYKGIASEGGHLGPGEKGIIEVGKSQ